MGCAAGGAGGLPSGPAPGMPPLLRRSPELASNLVLLPGPQTPSKRSLFLVATPGRWCPGPGPGSAPEREPLALELQDVPGAATRLPPGGHTNGPELACRRLACTQGLRPGGQRPPSPQPRLPQHPSQQRGLSCPPVGVPVPRPAVQSHTGLCTRPRPGWQTHVHSLGGEKTKTPQGFIRTCTHHRRGAPSSEGSLRFPPTQ